MNMNIYCIYDRKAEITRSLFTSDNDVSAIRGTVSAAKNMQTDLGQYPDDFELRFVGVLDSRMTELQPIDQPKLIGSVRTMLTASESEKNDTNK